IADLFTGALTVGLDVTQSGGKWYVNPVRSALDLYGEIFSALTAADLQALTTLIQSLASNYSSMLGGILH
ncbi:MAG: hypothetical protein FWD74_10750, partial [Actinomycetia bacterium]|nr:hypothetical protein [Actinomycetes bacterium]